MGKIHKIKDGSGNILYPVTVSDAVYVPGSQKKLSAVIDDSATKTQLTDGSVTKVGTADVGASNKPIYLNKGVPTAVGSVGEAFLSWGGTSFTGGYSPIDAAMVGDLGANRLAFVRAAGVVIQYSRDGGSTWTDYGASDTSKVGLFSLKNGASINLGKAGASQQADFAAHPANYLLRVYLRTSSASVYTVLNKLVLYVSTNGSGGSYVTLDVRTQDNYEKGVDSWVNRINKMSLSGWSGYNVANITGTTTYGNNKTGHYGEWRFTFGCTSYSPGTNTDGSYKPYYGLTICSIFGFGGVGWTTPSTMAATGHLYSFDASQNATFPSDIYAKVVRPTSNNSYTLGSSSYRWSTIYGTALNLNGEISGATTITATKLKVTGGTSSQFLKADGSVDSNTYLTQHQDISGKQDKITSSNKLAYSLISGTPTSLPASDVSAWAKKSSLDASDVPNLAISKITNLQTSLDGKQDVSTAINTSNISGQSVAFASNAAFIKNNRQIAVLISSTGWYRVFNSSGSNVYGNNIILHISRTYSNTNNEAYSFSINIAYNGSVSITQLSGVANVQLIKKIRVDYVNDNDLYVDMYIDTSAANFYYIYGEGIGDFVYPTLVSAPKGTTKEFVVSTSGVKSNGDITVEESFDGDAGVSVKNNNGNIALLTSTNRGVYDKSTSSWVVATNGTNTWLPQGNVGIGTTSPSAKLHVAGASQFEDNIRLLNSSDHHDTRTLCIGHANSNNVDSGNIIFQNGSYNGFKISGKHADWASRQDLVFYSSDNQVSPYAPVWSETMRITHDGKVGIGTSSPSEKLHVSGNILATGAITAGSASDLRLKSNVTTILNATDVLRSLRGVEFNWNETATDNCKDLNGHDVGMIAQEVEPYIPSAIGSIFGEYKRLDYTKITPYLIEGWKSHDNEIARLRARVEELERQVKQMKHIY